MALDILARLYSFCSMSRPIDPPDISFDGRGSHAYFRWLRRLWELHLERGREHDSNRDFASIRFAARLLGCSDAEQVAARLADKIGRFTHQWQAATNRGDPGTLADTLDDMAAYAGILKLMWEEGQNAVGATEPDAGSDGPQRYGIDERGGKPWKGLEQ